MAEPGQQGGPEEVRANLAEVRRRVAQAAAAAGRDPASVTLVAVGKAQPPERIEAALAAGQRAFGENYVQEAKGRWPELRRRWPGVELHLIGHLQSNKAAEAVALFDAIQTVDRPKLARELAKEMARQGRRPLLFVQVNTGEEPQKSGVAPGKLDPFLNFCQGELGLAVEGLMAIPPEDDDVALHAALLAKLARRHGLAALSVGMSGDFEAAIRFGATHVRVGTAIFGARPPRRG
jgi:pyridoxal phosphate enzyme (YggS family)